MFISSTVKSDKELIGLCLIPYTVAIKPNENKLRLRPKCKICNVNIDQNAM